MPGIDFPSVVVEKEAMEEEDECDQTQRQQVCVAVCGNQRRTGTENRGKRLRPAQQALLCLWWLLFYYFFFFFSSGKMLT